MFTHTKKLFQLSLITAFAALLFLGTAGVNTALADFQGKTKVKYTCFVDLGEIEKDKINSAARFDFDFGGSDMVALLEISEYIQETFLSGTFTAKKENALDFQLYGDGFDNGNGMFIIGTIKFAKDGGTPKRLTGKVYIAIEGCNASAPLKLKWVEQN